MEHCQAARKASLTKPHNSVPTYSHSIVKNYFQFVLVCRSLFQFVLFTPSLKKRRNSMGSNLGHGFSGHSRQRCWSRWVTANCEQQPIAAWRLYAKGGRLRLRDSLERSHRPRHSPLKRSHFPNQYTGMRSSAP